MCVTWATINNIVNLQQAFHNYTSYCEYDL